MRLCGLHNEDAATQTMSSAKVSQQAKGKPKQPETINYKQTFE